MFLLIQRLPPLQSNVQDREGEKDGVAKASLISFFVLFFFFLSSFFNAKSDSVWSIAAGYKTVLPPSNWPNKCGTVLIPF